MVPRRRRARAAHPCLHPLERRGHGRQRQPPRRRHRRPPVDASPRPPRSTRSASTTSSGARPTASPATPSTSRATPRPACTPGRSSSAASTRPSSTTSVASSPGGVAPGSSSYPHPWLMPDFWEYPTVSMGLGPINSIYQARFNRYLHNRRIDDTSGTRVWCFLGDGECDEPETLGSISLPAREGARQPHVGHQLQPAAARRSGARQRQDHPGARGACSAAPGGTSSRSSGVRAGTSCWRRDVDGVLLHKMNTTVDGEFQRYAVESGAYIREHFFGPDPRLRALVEHLSDDELRNLPRGGHDYEKIYAAYKAATEQVGAPTVILAKTIKGWTLGTDVEARNATHQIKKMTKAQLETLRTRLHLEDVISDEALEGDDPPYYRPPEDSPEYRYLVERRNALDGPLPSRSVAVRRPLTMPADAPFVELDAGSGAQSVSTTMAFTRLLRNLARAEGFGPRIVPIIPDEARTFGMDALFREFGIYAAAGPALRVGRRRAAAVLHREPGRPAARGGHHRGRIDGQLHRRRHVVRPPGRADGAVLRLLLDVRLPAGRRPDLGRGRRPGPRLPARGDRRSHHAARRGPAAPGRPQPGAGLDGAHLPGLRPGLRLRDGRHRARRHRPHVRRRAIRSSTTSPSTTRTTRCRPDPTG